MFNADTLSLKRGAVVSCFFPLSEEPDKPGPTARPALVIGVFHDRIDQQWKAIVAYGTSRKTRANTGYEVRINHPESLAMAGLARPTRFTLSRMRILPVNDAYFNSVDGNIVTGCLDSSLQNRLDQTCELLASVADPLRVITRPCAESLDLTEIAPIQQAASIRSIDRFMKSHLNGQSDLGGLRKRA